MKRIKIILLTLLAIFTGQVLLSQTNVSYGTGAGNSGSYNSSFGYYAGNAVTGNCNTFDGYYAGKQTTSGNYNVFNGGYAGYSNTEGDYNVYAGSRAGQVGSSGSFNVCIGYISGYNLTSGSDNVFLGVYSGRSAGTGSRNVYLGYGAGYNATGSDNVYIGYQAGYSASGDNKLYIENSNSSTPLIYGEFDNDFLAINGRLGIGTTDFDNAQLVVDGKIRANKITITTDDFPDYVFDNDYKLMPLEELEAFVFSNNHLPGIKPETEFKRDGMELSEMNLKLLEKIEELTLHIIELDKKKEVLKRRNTELQRKIDALSDAI